MAKNDKYWPTEEWFDALWLKVDEYTGAKKNSDYVLSDKLRAELVSAGISDLDTDPSWHPVSESKESRYARLKDI